ncbi:MAG: 2Fe-2S iron-sulfur cluster binding domain-containing protein [Acidobacteria bacterium]|nr:2Fe-2S iron-sulfur cluster binding domain-containing protein [Acidobacteriota bacterium]
MENQSGVHQVTIDGKPVSVENGTTILEAARRLGIEIPTLCRHPALEPYGVCRVCIVELKRGQRTRVVTACNFPIQEDGLAIHTNSEGIVRDRRTVLELLLARCFSSPVVREFAARFGVTDTDLTKTEGEHCTLCGRCVNVCRDLIGQAAIGFESRGAERTTAVPFRKPTDRCIGCGACVHVCPTHCIKMEDLPQDRMVDRWMTMAPILKCKACGNGFGTVSELELLRNRNPLVKSYFEKCPDCRAKDLGRSLMGKTHAGTEALVAG